MTLWMRSTRLLCFLFGHQYVDKLKGGRAIGSPTAPRDEAVILEWHRRCHWCGRVTDTWLSRVVRQQLGKW